MFVGRHGAEMEIFYVVNPENHNKCYYFTDTSELKLTLLSAFSFDTNFALCKNRYLHISMLNLVNPEEDIPS